MDHGRFPAERHRGPRRLQPKIFHKKFILRDYRKAARPTTALLTPANFTDTDTHKNLNSVFVFHDADVCRLYRVEVEQLRRGSFGRALHGEVPKTYDLGGVPVKVCSLLITRPSWSS